MNGNYQVGDTVLNNWRLVRFIGGGSYGKVFEAEREDFGKVYKSAIKIISIPQASAELDSARSEGLDDVSVETYFRGITEEIASEFEIMSRLKGHSNIVSYEDHSVLRHSEGIGWDIVIRMELLTPLPDLLGSGDIRLSNIVKLGMDICTALELCARENIIHRDVKPENIFLAPSGSFKLGDFGIARRIEKSSSLSKKGSYTYMAPEVFRDEQYDSRADVYSLGLVLYRLLNYNRTPFLPPAPTEYSHSDKEQALTRRMRGEPITPPVNAPAALAAIILKACAYRPEDRFQSAGEMKAALESYLDPKRAEANRPQSAPANTPNAAAIPPAQGSYSPHISHTARRQPAASVSKPKKRLGLIFAIVGAVAVLGVAALLLLTGVFGGSKGISFGNEREIIELSDELSLIRIYNRDGELVEVDVDCDYGELKEILFRNDDLRYVSELSFTDSKGLVVRKVILGSNGKKIETQESYKYDSDKRLSSLKRMDAEGKLIEVESYEYYGSETRVKRYNSADRLIREYSEDSSGRLLVDKSYDQSGRILSWDEYLRSPGGSYVQIKKDAEGTPVSKISFDKNDKKLWEASLYPDGTYDELTDYENDTEWIYLYRDDGSFDFRIKCLAAVGWGYGDEAVTVGLATVYPVLFDQPLENCLGLTFAQKNYGTSDCFGIYMLHVGLPDGRWPDYQEFEIPEGEWGSTEVWFDEPVTVTGLLGRFAGNRAFSYSCDNDIYDIWIADYRYEPR